MQGLCILLCLLVLAFGQDPDMLSPPKNLQTLPSGSYVVPMSTLHQNIIVKRTNNGVTYDSTEFNLKAYGLIVNLLYANIPVRWAIRSTKTNPGDTDFVAYAKQVYPTGVTYPAATQQQFSSGPFFIPPAYMNPPAAGGLSRADTVITNYGQKVAVYQVLADTSVDVRYTLQFKPKIGVLDDVSANNPNNIKIHTQVLINAGLAENTHYNIISSGSDATVGATTCYTLITEPHWDALYPAAVSFNTNIRSFLNNGGNFYGQCEGIDVFENCDNENMSVMLTYTATPSTDKSKNQCNGLLLTEKGLYTGDPNTGNYGDRIIRYRAAHTTFSQLESFTPVSGWIESFDLKKAADGSIASDFRAGTGGHFILSANDQTRGTNGYSFAMHGKMPAFINQIGGNVFYGGGHDYSGGGISKEGGQRLYLNAMLHPASRPACAFDIPPQVEEKECVLFDPWDHREFVFTPGCVPHITLDPGVGTETKDCDKYIALPDGWEIVTMTTSSSPGVDPKLNPAETQNVFDYGTAWAQSCIGGILPGKTPSPSGTVASPASTWTGYLSGKSTTTTCPPFSVDDTVIDSKTGRRCYKVSCGTSLLIRRPEHDPKCNSNNYGQYCDPASGSSYYTSSLSASPDTVYINLAGPNPLPVPFQIPLDHQANVYAVIDSFNVESTTSLKDMKSVARSLYSIYNYGTYDARAVGWGYNTAAGDWVSFSALNWDKNQVYNLAKSWAASKNSGNAVTGSTFKDSPILKTLTQAASSVSDWSPRTFREFWVVTKSLPISSQVAALSTAFGDSGPGAGIFVNFVTVPGLVTNYQTVCAQLPRCAVTSVDYPNLEPYSTTGTAPTSGETGEASKFIGPIFTTSSSLVGRVTIKELDDVYGFATAPADSWMTTQVTNAPTWSVQPGLTFSSNYASKPASFLLPSGWVGPASTSKLPVTINFKAIETGFSVKTIVSWNEPPILTVPSVTFTFSDLDSTPFYVPVVDSIRSSIDPNFNILSIKYLSLTFENNKNWVNSMEIRGGTSNGAAFPMTIPAGGTQWYDASLGFAIYPKAMPAGKMILTYQLTDKCLNSQVGTINVIYTITNTKPAALPKTIYMTVGEVATVDLRDLISDTITPDSALLINVLRVDVSLGTLKYKNGATTYADLPTLGSTSSVAYQDLQFTAGSTSGTTVFTYRVIDEGGLYADSTITFIINKPPTILVNPVSVITPPTTKGTWTVSMSDSPGDKLTLVLEAKVVTPTATMSTIITSIKSSNLAGGSIDLISTPLGNIIVDAPTTGTPVPGTVDVPMEWVPALAHPYGTTTTLTFYALDDYGLRSLTSASVTLGIPKNEPPVWRTTTPTPAAAKTTTSLSSWSYEFPQDVGAITFLISGDDVNLADTEKLTFTVTSFPDPAKGSLFYLDSTGTRVALTSSSPTIPLSADKSTSSDGKTSFQVVYVPTASVATSSVVINDFFRGVWTDPAAANSDIGIVNLAFTLVNKKPTCASLSATATQGVNLPLLLSGSDPDGNLLKLRIKTQSIQQTPGIVSDVKDPASASIVGIALPKDYTLAAIAAQSTWQFTYYTNRFATVQTDSFTYTVVDQAGLESSPCTVTITTTIVNQAPVVTGYTYTINEGDTLPIQFWWPTLPAGQDGPTYSDVDGTQSATTLTLLSALQSTISGKEGTWTRSDGSAIAIGQSSATLVSSSNPSIIYKAPDQVAPGADSVVTFTFNAVDSVSSPLVSKTSNTATVTINVKPVDDPPTISLTPSLIVTDPSNWVRSFTVAVTDIDSNTANVYLTDAGIPWPVDADHLGTDTMAPPDGTPLSNIPTITVYDNAGTKVKTYPGDTAYGFTSNDLIINLVKVGGVFPTFTITWDARSHFTVDKLGSLQVQAVADMKSSNVATGDLKFLYVAPPNVLPTTQDVLIVINEDSCALASTCVTTFQPLKASDDNTKQTEGDILTVSLGSASYTGKLVYQATTPSSRTTLPVPSSSLTTGFLSQVDTTAVPRQWLLSYEPIANDNSGNLCTCTAGTAETDYSKCSGCTPIVIPFTILDSKGGVSTPANLRIVILPQDDPPLSQSITKKAVKDVKLSIDIPATDVDGDLVCIVFQKPTTVFDSATLTYVASSTVVNPDKVPTPDDTFCMTKSAASTFTFEFLSPSTNAVTNVYPFKVRDEKGNLSQLYTLTVSLDRTPLNPVATGTTVTGLEDNPVKIPISYKDSSSAQPGEGTYKDPDGTQAQTYIVVTTVPPKSEGTLYGPSGEEITANTPVYVQNPEFTFVPTAEWSGTSSFQFKSVDSESLESTPATVNVVITPVDDPPTITMTPVKIVNNRGVLGTFTVTVNDIDSTDVGVLVLKDGLADLFSMPADSTFNFPAVGGILTPVPSSGLVKRVTLPKAGSEVSFTMDWTPLASIPDTATGSFTLYAANDKTGSWDGPRSHTSVTGNVGVLTPNNPPKVIPDPVLPYSFSAIDGKWTSQPFHLTGDDPDAIHADVLEITITRIPNGLTLLDKDGNVLKAGDKLYTPGPTGGDPVDDLKTFAPVTLVPTPGSPPFIGSTSFAFTVTDLVGATSEPQNIPIDIIRGNVPPTSSDEILVIPEDYCTTAFCGVTPVFSTLKALKYATLSTRDDNNDNVWLRFLSLPGQETTLGDPTTKTGAGKIGWFPFGERDTDYFVLDKYGPFVKPGNVPNPDWDLWFQPPVNAFSATAQAGDPYALTVDGKSLLPYSALTFRVYDIDPSPIVNSFPDELTAQTDILGCPTPVCTENAATCADPAANAWICTTIPDTTDHESPVYYLRIYVVPVNDPPTSQSLSYTINEDDYTAPGDYLKIDIPYVDVDSTDSQIGVQTLGYTGAGTFYTRNGQGLVEPLVINRDGTLTIQRGDRQLLFKPDPNVFSDPGKPLVTLNFKVYDQGPLFSPPYDVKIYVNSVPDVPEWLKEKEITILEDSSASIPLNGRDERWSSHDDGNGVIFITSIGAKGTFTQCVLDKCVVLKSGDNLPFPLTEGKINYKPLPNENGLVNGDGSLKPDGTPTYFYTSFNFKLWVYPGDSTFPTTIKDIPVEAIGLEINFKINVVPVNDPPVLVPGWFPATGPVVNECDEDTYLRVRFTAVDIDSDCATLEADALIELDQFQASMYSCATTTPVSCLTEPHQCLSTPADCKSALTTPENCATPATKVATIGRVQKIGPAQWEVSFVPYPNWNGNLLMKFVVWDECTAARPDCDLLSEIHSVLVHVRPINDAPSIVKKSTRVNLEYWNDNRSTSQKAKRVQEPRKPGENAGDFTLVDATPKEGGYEIHERDSQDQRQLQGNVIEKYTATTVVDVPENPDPKKPLVTIYRLKTQIQDIDFFFQYSLLMECSLIHAVFVPQVTHPSAPCVFANDFTVSCEKEIRAFNNFLAFNGFALTIEDDATQGVALFLLNDTGNVDKLDRPAAAGFTILVFKEIPPEVYVVPVAAIVILPVIAAATAASIAAAWFFLGQRAQDYVVAGFDSFAVMSHGTGTQSPLYNDQGREVRSPIYGGAK